MFGTTLFWILTRHDPDGTKCYDTLCVSLVSFVASVPAVEGGRNIALGAKLNIDGYRYQNIVLDSAIRPGAVVPVRRSQR